jgi:DNA-binding LytR/AlgR family response regulator
MENLKVLIVEDEHLAAEGLKSYIAEIDFLQLVVYCENALEANRILSEQSIDLIFLDIQMPKLTGIDFLKSLSKPPMVIFTTAYSDYAVEGFEVNAIDYLVKPFTFDRFFSAIQKAQKRLNETAAKELTQPSPHEPAQESFFYVKADKKLSKVKFEDILFIEGLKDYVIIKRKTDRIVTLQTMKGLEKKLPTHLFRRVHRSYIIALDKIEAIVGNSVEIIDGKSKKLIPIGKNYRDEILDVVNRNRL